MTSSLSESHINDKIPIRVLFKESMKSNKLVKADDLISTNRIFLDILCYRSLYIY